jgi:hypothetical protein
LRPRCGGGTDIRPLSTCISDVSNAPSRRDILTSNDGEIADGSTAHRLISSETDSILKLVAD